MAHARERGVSPLAAGEFVALPGQGVRCRVHQTVLQAGSLPWLASLGCPVPAAHVADLERLESAGKTVVGLARDNVLLGAIAMADTLKPGPCCVFFFPCFRSFLFFFTETAAARAPLFPACAQRPRRWCGCCRSKAGA